jgi:hypothetical protein
VVVGGEILVSVQTSDTTIEVSLPEGNRLDTAVLISQAAGEMTTTPMTVDYHQCQAGEYESSYDCLQCDVGTAQPYVLFTLSISINPYSLYTCVPCFHRSTSQVQCLACTPGYYANVTGLASCLPCAGILTFNIRALFDEGYSVFCVEK